MFSQNWELHALVRWSFIARSNTSHFLKNFYGYYFSISNQHHLFLHGLGRLTVEYMSRELCEAREANVLDD